MKWTDTVASKCTWSEHAEFLFNDKDIMLDLSNCDYQGTVLVVARSKIHGVFYVLDYEYGSCEGCDSWYKLSDDKLKEEMLRCLGRKTKAQLAKQLQTKLDDEWYDEDKKKEIEAFLVEMKK